MKKIYLLIFFFLSFNSFAISKEPKLQEIINGLNSPWSLSFINKNLVLISEKPGNLVLADLENKKIKKIYII